MSSWLVSFVPAWTTSIQPVVARPMLGSDFAWDSGHTGVSRTSFLPDHNVLPGPNVVSTLPGHTLRFNQVGMLLRLS